MDELMSFSQAASKVARAFLLVGNFMALGYVGYLIADATGEPIWATTAAVVWVWSSLRP